MPIKRGVVLVAIIRRRINWRRNAKRCRQSLFQNFIMSLCAAFFPLFEITLRRRRGKKKLNFTVIRQRCMQTWILFEIQFLKTDQKFSTIHLSFFFYFFLIFFLSSLILFYLFDCKKNKRSVKLKSQRDKKWKTEKNVGLIGRNRILRYFQNIPYKLNPSRIIKINLAWGKRSEKKRIFFLAASAIVFAQLNRSSKFNFIRTKYKLLSNL